MLGKRREERRKLIEKKGRINYASDNEKGIK